jgi:hypothetical protein
MPMYETCRLAFSQREPDNLPRVYTSRSLPYKLPALDTPAIQPP